MRLSSIVTLLLSVAALVLTLLCLFAGTTKSFLQSGDLLTLNVSRIGHGEAFNTSDGDGGLLSTLGNDLEGDLNNLLNDAADGVSDALNLTDFYTVHLMNYCDGFFEPNATDRHPKKNVTFCSSRDALFHFNPTKIVNDSLPKGISLDDIDWPKEVTDAEKAVKAASIVMFVFYCIGIGFAGLAVIGAIFGFFTEGRLSACGNFVLDVLALLTIGIASAVSTAIIVKATNAVNKYGNDIGVSATKGTTFLGLTWGATAAMLLAAFVSIAQCVAGRRHRSRSHGEKPY